MKSIYQEEYIELISRLRAHRINVEITQTEVARYLQTTQSTISKIENCERRLDIIEFLNYIEILNLKLEDVISRKQSGGK